MCAAVVATSFNCTECNQSAKRNSEEWLTIEDAHDDEIQAIEFTADGQYIVSGSKDKTIKMWSVQTGKLVRVLVDKDFSILAMAISPDGKTFI